MSGKGRPTVKKIHNVLLEVDSLQSFPSDDELEARRRLCVAAFASANGSFKPVNFYTIMTKYAIDNNCTFNEDIQRRFDCEEQGDMGDAETLFEMLKKRNMVELGIGRPRQGRCDFYPYFDWSDVDMIHRRIRENRDRIN